MTKYLGACMALHSNAATKVASIVMYVMLGSSMATQTSKFLEDYTVEAPPQSGDLVGKVKQQLASEHRVLGKVSQSLMSIQTNVDKTEQSMLGKVLDLQTARSFFTRHEEIDTSNKKLEDEVAELNTQVEDLSSTLSKVQKEFLSNAASNAKSEGKLEGEDTENKEMIASMNKELDKEGDVEKSLKKLEKIHDDLMKEAVETLKAGKKSVDMLKEARIASRQEVGKHRGLRHQLVEMNNYSVACHVKVQDVSKKVGRALMKDANDNKASIMTSAQKQKASAASQQRLLAEKALLISEVKKYEKEEKESIDRMRDLREDMKVLEAGILKEVRDVEKKLKEEKERVKGLRVALLENVQAEEQDVIRKDATDAKIKELVGQIHDEQNPVIIATTEGQNDALQAELNQAYAMWKVVKKAETAATLNRDQAMQDMKAEQEGLRLANEALAAAQAEGQKNLEEAVKKTNQSKKKAQDIIDKAQAVIAGRCKPKWDAIRKKKFAKLKKCKAWEKDLEMELAKKDLLMQTAKAQADAQA